MIIPKGQYDQARGLPALLDDIARRAPILKPGLTEVKNWDDVTAVPWLQGITARFVGVGVRPEHVQPPVRA